MNAERKKRTELHDSLLCRAARRSASASGWALPGALLILMPKCPMCVAAYVGIATGIGISVSAAAHLRWAMLAVCTATLAYVAAELLARLMRTLGYRQLQ